MKYLGTLATLALTGILLAGCAVEDWEQLDDYDPQDTDVVAGLDAEEDSATDPVKDGEEVGKAASTPTALGTVLANGNKYAGSTNWTSIYNPTYQRYEITVSGENYYYLGYATNVTPAGDARFCRTGSVNGKLLVYCHDANGNVTQSRFAFVTFEL